MDEQIEIQYKIHNGGGDYFYTVGECPDGCLTRIAYLETAREKEGAILFVDIADDSLFALYQVLGKVIEEKGLQFPE